MPLDSNDEEGICHKCGEDSDFICIQCLSEFCYNCSKEHIMTIYCRKNCHLCLSGFCLNTRFNFICDFCAPGEYYETKERQQSNIRVMQREFHANMLIKIKSK